MSSEYRKARCFYALHLRESGAGLAEIAARLDRSPKTLKSYFHDARRRRWMDELRAKHAVERVPA